MQFDKMYREKSRKYDEEQQSNIRKGELQERLAVLGEEIPKVRSVSVTGFS